MTDELAYIQQMQAELEELRQHSEARPELMRRFEEAEHTLPAGYAVVLAAADCGRVGSKYPIPANDLIGLARGYWARLWPGEPVGDDELRAGIDWAASCEGDQPPLLIPDGDDAYRASPGIDRRGFDVPAVPPETWDWLFAHLPPFRLLELGDVTNLSPFEQDKRMTEQAWARALETGDERVRSAASLALGLLYAGRGDDEDAITALERVDASLMTRSAQATTGLALGLLYDGRKDVERARGYYEQAIEADDWQASAEAAYNLGLLLGDLGDVDGAEAAFTHAIEAEYYPDGDRAVYALAITLQKLGELDRAKVYYERAIATDSIGSDVPCRAALRLGRLHEAQGADDEAMAAYERGVTGCNDKLITEAIWHHARLAAPKEKVEPVVVYQRMLGRLRHYMEPAVACRLGQWLWCHGEHAAAAVVLERVMASDRGHDSAEAAFLRGWLAQAHNQDDVTARACYQMAIDSRSHEHAARATNNLGVLLAEQGEHDEGLAAFQRVRNYPRCTATAKATFNAGLLLERAGRTDEARTAFEWAIDPDRPGPLPRAVAHLAHLLLRTGDKDAADALLEQWRNADDQDLAEAVAFEFDELQSELQSSPTTRDLWLMTEPW